MRVLLDEGLPKQLARALQGFGIQASAFPNSWKGTRNGMLLNRTESEGFDVLLSNDARLYAQQNLAARKIAVVSLPTNWRPVLLRHVDDIAASLHLVQQGECMLIALNGERRLLRLGVWIQLDPIAVFLLEPE